MPLDDHQIRDIIKTQRKKVSAKEPKQGTPPGNLVDLMVFFLGWDAYRNLVGEEDSHYESSLQLLRRYQPILKDGLEAHFAVVMDKPGFTTFAPLFRQATRSTRGVAQAELQVDFIQQVMPRLRAKPDIMRSIFTGKAKAPALRLSAVAGEDSPESVLANLATIPSASRTRITKQWLKVAIGRIGVEPSDLEATLTDTADARNLGEDLAKIEAKLDSVDPSSQEAVDLQTQRSTILSDIEDLAEQSANPDAVVAAAASVVVSKPRDFASNAGRAQGLSEDQEAAMMIRGKGVIAAGAGSGKTRVLASKVVYHIKELGVPPSAIMATSFSRKSAAELRARIEKYGASFSERDATGLGTTHSIAAKLMRNYGGGRVGREGVKDYEQTSLVRLAMEQAQMGGPGAFGDPPPPTSIFGAGVVPGATPDTGDDLADAPTMSFKDALQQAFNARGRMSSGFLRGFIESYFNPSDRWYGLTKRKTKDFTDPAGLTDKQKKILADIFRYTGVAFDVYNYTPPRTAAEIDEIVKEIMAKQAAKAKEAAKTRDKDKGLREKYEYFSRPARQWFNRGFELVEEDSQGNKKPLPVGQFKSAITKWKGRLVSPSEAWEQTSGAPEAAVYAAYEWLKSPRGEQDFQGKGDFDDVLIDVSKMMLTNPRARKQIQARFNTVLVDEAQDLNRSQHMMFGLITGYIDPDKAHLVGSAEKMSELSRDDGKMSADTYCFIGDDKQAIYEFRSADPEAFIDMSDLVEGGAGFKTQLLETNYRSGRKIVEAANQLISHNSKQIPMVCNANPTRDDEGGVDIVRFAPDSSEAAAEWVADKIMSDLEEGVAGEGTEKPSYDSYGLALRTNAEAYTYGLELLKRGIPFRSKVSFFRDPNTKALLHWLTIADEGMNGDPDRINEAVLNARTAPVTMLGKKFVEKLEEMGTGNYLQWLQTNWGRIYGNRGKWGSLVKSYVDNLTKVATLREQPELADASSEAILNEILQLQGFDGGNIKEALIDRVQNDEEKLAELRALSAKGEVSQEEIEEMALAPIAPLKGLLEARANLEEAMKFTRRLQRANDKLAAYDDPNNPKAKEPAVTLGTMHSWKGLEVPNVIIPMVGGRFPRGDADEDDLASERRLAYVAITRGENKVHVLDIPTSRTLSDGRVIIQRSQFTEEMCVPSISTSDISDSDPAVLEEAEEFHEALQDKFAARSASGPQLVLAFSPLDPRIIEAYEKGELPDDYFALGTVSKKEV